MRQPGLHFDRVVSDALVDALEARQATDAADLMRSHMVDLLSGLDLSRGETKPEKLADILR